MMNIKRYILVAVAVLAAATACSKEGTRVILGDEQLSEYLPLLEGKKVAIFSNQTGIVGDKVEGVKVLPGIAVNDEQSMVPFGTPAVEGGEVVLGPHLLDVLIEKKVNVTAIFSPEHGFRGTADAGEHVSSSVDEKTGVPILSLYESGSNLPSAESMSKFDVLVVDIQDVGLRYYTYYVTMYRLMEACLKYDKKMVILDRPNPNGFYVDGPILDMSLKSGVGALPIAMVHGMTLGELAMMINGEGWLSDGAKCDVSVITCKNYTHQTRYSLLLAPSPNLKDMKAVYLYASTCFFEGTIISLGRGTSFPFEAYGHPDMTGYEFSFTPKSIDGAKNPPLLEQLCNGVDLRKKPLEEILSEHTNLEYIVDAYTNLNVGDSFFGKNNFFELLIGQRYVREMIESGKSASEIKATWSDDVEKFKKQRKPYLLYAE
ncbi:MAG: DUF1343 domain-containing protein [Bacteroidales bacterium]|nr:DUF1343 domain-containing protein [Bacteroidales bacterium]